MRCSKSKSIVFSALAVATSADAFAFVSPNPNIVRPQSFLAAAKDDDGHGQDSKNTPPQVLRNVVALSAITLGLLAPSSDARATQDARDFILFPNAPQITQLNQNSALHSSTVTVSEVIRTMDFSLPSSYDDISDPIASGADELTIPAIKSATGSTPKKVDKPKKSSTGGGGRSMGISLPKVNLGGGGGAGGGGGSGGAADSGSITASMTAEERAAALAKRRAEREEAVAREKAEAAEREKQAAEERSARITAGRLERIAKRQEEQAEKEAAEAAKREEMFKGAKIVDTSMPQY